MADILLGPDTEETILPVINWRAGATPELPVIHHKQVEEVVMSDGSIRLAFFGKKREWTITWGNLIKADLDIIEGLVDLKQVLKFQNNWEDATKYDVYISAFSHNPIVATYVGTIKYACSLTIREV